MEDLKQKAIKAIVESIGYSEKDAEVELNSSVLGLQELVCMKDLRRSDIRNEVEGLCGYFNEDVVEYISAMIREENIPDYIKERFTPEDAQEEEEVGCGENEFNPYDYIGLLGAEVCQEAFEMMM